MNKQQRMKRKGKGGVGTHIGQAAGHLRDCHGRLQKELDVVEQAGLNVRVVARELLQEPETGPEDTRHL